MRAWILELARLVEVSEVVAAAVGERACCHLRGETARNKRREKDKGTYVVVRRYKLANIFRGGGSHWCSHAILSRKWRANG